MSINLDAAAYPAIIKVAHGMGVPAEWLLRILYEESGLDPASDNGSFVGLNQLSKKYLSDRRIDPTDYKTWSASRQIIEVIGPWYTAALQGKKPPTIGAMYGFNLAPTTMANSNMSPNTVVLSGSNYESNKALRNQRVGGPDALLVSDLDAFLQRKAMEIPYAKPRQLLAQAEPAQKLAWYVRYAPAAIAVGIFVAVVTWVGGRK